MILLLLWEGCYGGYWIMKNVQPPLLSPHLQVRIYRSNYSCMSTPAKYLSRKKKGVDLCQPLWRAQDLHSSTSNCSKPKRLFINSFASLLYAKA